MKSLIYYTVGYNSKYIDLIDLSLKTLNYYHPGEFDILLLCDESMYTTCKYRFTNINVISCANSPTPESASMRKLDVFDYDIMGYDKVLFIDCDILIHTKLDSIMNGIINNEKLYVYTEYEDLKWHRDIYFSLLKYTNEQLEYLSTNKIYPFNAGLFGFVPSEIMKNHFSNIRQMIKTHVGKFFYEQSFMNVYFNLNNETIRDVITSANYKMHPKDDVNYEGTLVHFCGGVGDPVYKYPRITKYISNYMN